MFWQKRNGDKEEKVMLDNALQVDAQSPSAWSPPDSPQTADNFYATAAAFPGSPGSPTVDSQAPMMTEGGQLTGGHAMIHTDMTTPTGVSMEMVVTPTGPVVPGGDALSNEEAAELVMATEPEEMPNLPRMNSEDDPLNELYSAVHKTTDDGGHDARSSHVETADLPDEDNIEEDVSQDLPVEEDEPDPLEE